MGLLDNLESMAMSKVAGSNPEAAGVLEMIQNHPGGLNGLLQFVSRQRHERSG
jgi:hypothetical protein